MQGCLPTCARCLRSHRSSAWSSSQKTIHSRRTQNCVDTNHCAQALAHKTLDTKLCSCAGTRTGFMNRNLLGMHDQKTLILDQEDQEWKQASPSQLSCLVLLSNNIHRMKKQGSRPMGTEPEGGCAPCCICAHAPIGSPFPLLGAQQIKAAHVLIEGQHHLPRNLLFLERSK